MARYGRRRRPGPSKNEKKVRRRGDGDPIAGAPLKQVFPMLEKLSVKFTFTDARGAVVQEESRDFGASDPCDLTFTCPGICGVGTFNMTERIERAITENEAKFEAVAPCGSPRYGTVSEACGTTFKCSVELSLSGAPAQSSAE